MEVTTIEELQEKAGLTTSNEGIINLSVARKPELYELLKPYIETADNHMYYNYGNRLLTKRFEHAFIMDNLTYIESAILYALLSEEYRLKLLIESTNFEYNPIDNYDITEQIVTTTTYSDKYVRGQQVNNENVGEIKTTGTSSDTKQYGAINETGSNDTTYGQYNDNTTQTTDYGERQENGSSTLTVSPYNNDNYHNKEKTATTDTKSAVTDTVTTLEQLSEHKDKVSTSKLIQARTDSDSGSTSKTQSAYSIKNTLGDRTDETDRNNNEDKQRHVHGRYGYTTTQALIQAERDIANLSIVEEIIKIVLRTITLNVLFLD